MKFYYYLLFRLYNTLSEPKKQNNEKTIIYLTVSTSTFLLYFSLSTIIFFIDFYFFEISNQILSNKFIIILLMGITGFLNYCFFIKDKRFLNYNFKSDKKGGYAIIWVIVLLAFAFVFIANKNREKIFKEREKARIENAK